MLKKRSYTKNKICAKTNLDVKKSQLYSASKELIRISKIIKGFLIQKSSRRINDLLKETESREIEEVRSLGIFIDTLKSMNHW